MVVKWEFLTFISPTTSDYWGPDWLRGDGSEDLKYKSFDEAGQDGWELVSVIATEAARSFYFKRPVNDVELVQFKG